MYKYEHVLPDNICLGTSHPDHATSSVFRTTNWNPRTSPFPPPDRTVLRGSLRRRVNLKMSPGSLNMLRVGSRQPTPRIQQLGCVAAATQNGWLSPANPVFSTLWLHRRREKFSVGCLFLSVASWSPLSLLNPS